MVLSYLVCTIIYVLAVVVAYVQRILWRSDKSTTALVLTRIKIWWRGGGSVNLPNRSQNGPKCYILCWPEWFLLLER